MRACLELLRRANPVSMPRGSARDAASRGKKKAGAAAAAAGGRVVLDRGTHKAAKDCCQCGRIITWRKKWEKDWESVKYCSGKCRHAAAKQRGRESSTSDEQ
jgi:hypothetical protein